MKVLYCTYFMTSATFTCCYKISDHNQAMCPPSLFSVFLPPLSLSLSLRLTLSRLLFNNILDQIVMALATVIKIKLKITL